MILGVGTDLVEVVRCAQVLRRHPQRFVERILTPQEQAGFRAATHPERHLAKRFAAKEAAAKALGTGIAAGVGWHDLWIAADERGRPQLGLSAAVCARFAPGRQLLTHLSISDERDYALAFVVLELGAVPASQA